MKINSKDIAINVYFYFVFHDIKYFHAMEEQLKHKKIKNNLPEWIEKEIEDGNDSFIKIALKKWSNNRNDMEREVSVIINVLESIYEDKIICERKCSTRFIQRIIYLKNKLTQG